MCGGGRGVLTTSEIELEGSVSLPDSNPPAPIDLEQLLPDVYEAVQWACLRYRGRVLKDELDDFSQQVILKLIEDDCRRLRSFNYNFSLKTWLQAVVSHHIYKYLYWQKQAESLDEVDQVALLYAPTQDQDVYVTEKRKILSRALGELSEQEWMFYQLWFVFELPPSDIATYFGTEVKVIYKRKQTLVLKLARIVQTSCNR
jgi:RNA polymerase sigma factor (sigma-70 family)